MNGLCGIDNEWTRYWYRYIKSWVNLKNTFTLPCYLGFHTHEIRSKTCPRAIGTTFFMKLEMELMVS